MTALRLSKTREGPSFGRSWILDAGFSGPAWPNQRLLKMRIDVIVTESVVRQTSALHPESKLGSCPDSLRGPCPSSTDPIDSGSPQEEIRHGVSEGKATPPVEAQDLRHLPQKLPADLGRAEDLRGTRVQGQVAHAEVPGQEGQEGR